LCGEHLQELYIVNLTKLSYHPNKNLGGERPQTDKHLPPNPFTGKFIRKNGL
jgi:hypothetical protein